MKTIGFILLTILIATGSSFSQKISKHSGNVLSPDTKVMVYTTAQNTDFRISKTDTLEFSDFKQPLETDVCVFVDPSNNFQSLVGIGGALTDAAAETFAKLPADKQKEFLTSVEARRSTQNKSSLNSPQSHSKVKQIKSGRVDASAAALILQRYLDRRSRQDGVR